MTIRVRILLAMLGLSAVGLGALTKVLIEELEPQLRQTTEEPLIETARLLAGILAETSVTPAPPLPPDWLGPAMRAVLDQRFEARIYNFMKRRVDLRIYITDARGTVVFDSDGRDVGKDYARYNDVMRSLEGRYGSRTSRDLPGEPDLSVMYVAAPVIRQGRTLGVVSVGKPTRNVNHFERVAQMRVMGGTAVIFTIGVLGAWLLSSRLTRPISDLTEYARRIGKGERPPPPALRDPEMSVLAQAFEEMRDALEGRRYVERYVETLTHEIKSPVAAVRGAAELMREDMPPERREKFLTNILGEVERIEGLVEKLLLLARVENVKQLGEIEPHEADDMVRQVLRSLAPLLERRSLAAEVAVTPELPLRGDGFLLEHALRNLLQNAIDFGPPGSRITVTGGAGDGVTEITVEDEGPGIPDYALGRLTERFFSLARPDTGKKGSGLGLALVAEVARLHGGSFTIGNREGRPGARAVLRLPSST